MWYEYQCDRNYLYIMICNDDYSRSCSLTKWLIIRRNNICASLYFLNVTYEECYIHFWNYSETKIVSKSFYVYTAKMNYKRVLDCTSPKTPKLFLDNITIWSFSLSKVSLIIFNDVGDIKKTKFIIIYLINEISSNILMIVILIKRYVIFNCNKI